MGQELQINDFDYPLPVELIAQEPAARRDQARLLVVDRTRQSFSHHLISDLPSLLRNDDLLVFNDTMVIPARLYGSRATTGGKWEGLFLQIHPEGNWELLAHTRGYIRAGEWINLTDRSCTPSLFRLKVIGRTADHHLLVKPDPFIEPLELLQAIGHIPLPPYIRKGIDQQEDRDRYQTVYAQKVGSVAAPTAGLHFTSELLSQLKAAGVEQAWVTLHVGLGTFLPVKVQNLCDHKMHSEWCTLPADIALKINQCRSRGSRVIAVGTTTTRTLESAGLNQKGPLQSWTGTTDLFIRPPFTFQWTDALLTNFHLPQTTLLVLVCTFAGRELMLEAYAEAVRHRYRFFSYGDAMLIL